MMTMRAQLAAELAGFDARFADFEAALAEEGWALEQVLPSCATSPRLLDRLEGERDAGAPQSLAAAGAER